MILDVLQAGYRLPQGPIPRNTYLKMNPKAIFSIHSEGVLFQLFGLLLSIH